MQHPKDAWANPHDTEVPDLGGGLKPFNYRIVIMPVSPPEKTAGGILIADTTQEAHEWMNYVGRVIDMGAGAYKHKKFQDLGLTDDDIPKIGDWVIYAPYQPYRISYKGVKLVILNDENIVGIIPDGVSPWDFRTI